MTEPVSDRGASPATGRRGFGREWRGLLAVIAVVLIGYGIAPARLPLVGEETRRIQHGVEMAGTGDWIIARNQGVPILDRPPLQYWTLALIHRFVHPLDPLTARLSMVLVTLATALIVYWYARAFVSTTGATLAGVAYPTMGHVFDLGRRAETDGLFALLLVASLLVWHRGYARGRSMLRTWVLASILAALAALAKGLQAPVAFYGAIGLFLLLKRDWRTLSHWTSLVGAGLFVGVVAIWQVPFYLAEGWEGTRDTWLTPGAHRMGFDLWALISHLVGFPLKVLGATLPWSPLLLGLISRRFWAMDERLRSCVLFNILAILAIMGPVWINVGGHHRYVLPMYPMLGVLCGVVAHQALRLEPHENLRGFWRDYVRIVGAVFVLTSIGLLGVTIAAQFDDSKWVRTLAQPWWMLAIVLVASAGGAVVLFRRAAGDQGTDSPVVPALIGLLLAVMFNGPVMHSTIANAEAVGPEVVAIRDSLPEGAQLVSFGPIHHKFLYWYADPIPILPYPSTMSDVPDGLEYFALTVNRGVEVDLPFEWEQIARLNMDRTRQIDPQRSVIVGRRIAR